MNGGKFLQVGTPEEIYHHPATRVVADFLGRCNFLTARATDASAAGNASAGGLVRLVLTANGKPLTVPGEGLATSGEVQVAVRPEAVELVGPESAAENTYQAEVRTVSFLGDHYLYELDVDGLPLTVTCTRSVAGPSVMVRLPPSACRILAP
jgi:ABC-type Fe3+/spermidine/putrescine transport system ATPase subunit